MNGASGSENQFTVDGVSTNSLLAGQSRQNTVFEYLQEVQVKTVGIPAEYGGALGGVISAVTKSGGNAFHGEGHYYFSGSALSAGPVKRLVLSPVDDRTVFTVQDDKQDDVRNEVGGSLGGPIVRDRLFFFGSISPRFNARTNDYLFSSGTEPGSIKRDQTIMSAYGKVSYASRRVNAYFGALLTPTTSEGTLPAYGGTGPQFISSSKASNDVNLTRGYETEPAHPHWQRRYQYLQYVVCEHESRALLRQLRRHGRSVDHTVVLRNCHASPARHARQQFVGPRLTQNTPAVQIVDHDTTKQTYFQADYNASFSAAGFHTLKVGAGVRHNENDVDQRYPGGRVLLYWDSSVQSTVPGVAVSRGTYGYYTVDDLGTFGEASANIAHFYVQDQWSVGRLTLNLGLRLEDEKIPAFREREVAIAFGWGEKIAPTDWSGVRHVRRRPHEAVRQLRPLLRLDEVRARARHVRRRYLDHVLPPSR